MASTSATASGSPSEMATQSIKAYVSGAYEAGELPEPLAEVLRSGSLTLLQLIKLLGEYLTSEDEQTRSRGVEILAQVVLSLAPSGQVSDASSVATSKLFDRQAVRTLTTFFADKLQDGSNVAASIAKANNATGEAVPGSAPSYRFKAIPIGTEMLASTLNALTRLASLQGFGAEQTRTVAKELFTHVTPRDHPQAVRFLVYSLLDALLSRHRAAIKSMGDDFLKGYIDLAEGEKDPRNLMYLFAMDRVILIEWDLTPEQAEALYDITYCYFPITFRPPPDDPYGISTEDLKSALRSCLTANPLLAPHAMPLLLEKLAASGGNTKRDTLHTLTEAMPVFGKAAVLANQKKLWEGFKVEIMAATDEETSLYAQRAVASFLRTLYGHSDDSTEGIATRIVAEALDELQEPEKSLAKPASELLVAMVKACPATAHLATYALLDQMLTMFKDPEVVSVRGPILGHIATLLAALREVYRSEDGDEIAGAVVTPSSAGVHQASSLKFAAPASTTQEIAKPSEDGAAAGASSSTATTDPAARSYDGDRRPLDPLRDELLSALSNGVRSTSYRASALLAFVHLTHIPTFLSAAETNYIAQSVNDLILSPGADDVRGAALDGLRDIARVNPRVLEETTLPLLFSRLPERMGGAGLDEEGAFEQRGVVRRVLGSLARLSTPPELFEMLVVRLFAKLDLLCHLTQEGQEREANVGYLRGLLVTLLTVLEEKVAKKHTDVPKYGGTLPARLFTIALEAGRADKATTLPLASDSRVLQEIGRLTTVLLRSLGAEKQRELNASLRTAFLSDDGPLSPASPAHRKDTLFVYASAIMALRKEIAIEGLTLSQLLTFTIEATTNLQADAGFTLLATLVNKHVAEPIPDEVQRTLDDFWSKEVATSSTSSSSSNNKGESGRRQRAIHAWFWIAKALVVRNSKTGEAMVERARVALFEGSENESDAGKEAARSLSLLARADDGVLSKENNAVVRLLYRQKFFAYLVPRIIDGYHAHSKGDADSTSSSVYLIALSSLLPHMPRPMIQERLASIFPLLIRALDLPDASARASAATTITLAAAVGKKERDAEIKAGGRSSSENDGKTKPLDLVESHIHTLIDRLLILCKPATYCTVPVRVAALRCLATLVRCLPFSRLRCEQVKVTRALSANGVGVDDPRREVRQVAVDTRAVWATQLVGE